MYIGLHVILISFVFGRQWVHTRKPAILTDFHCFSMSLQSCVRTVPQVGPRAMYATCFVLCCSLVLSFGAMQWDTMNHKQTNIYRVFLEQLIQECAVFTNLIFSALFAESLHLTISRAISTQFTSSSPVSLRFLVIFLVVISNKFNGVFTDCA